MIKDPYRVLGVTPSATDEELKKAYRLQSKKWHPDQHLDDQAYAEARFKEVQEAYRQIMDARAHGGTGYGSDGPGTGGYSQQSSGSYGGQQSYGQNYGYQGGTYGGFDEFFRQWSQNAGGQWSGQGGTQESNEARAAETYIANGMYREAMNALGDVPDGQRDARWYYLASVASSQLGSNVDALNYAKRACDLEPENMQYRSYLQQMQRGGMWYQQRNANYGGFGGNASTWCLSLCALNILCNCCLSGGRFM